MIEVQQTSGLKNGVPYKMQGNIVYHLSKVSDIVLIVKPAEDIAKSDCEKKLLQF